MKIQAWTYHCLITFCFEELGRNESILVEIQLVNSYNTQREKVIGVNSEQNLCKRLLSEKLTASCLYSSDVAVDASVC